MQDKTKNRKLLLFRFLVLIIGIFVTNTLMNIGLLKDDRKQGVLSLKDTDGLKQVLLAHADVPPVSACGGGGCGCGTGGCSGGCSGGGSTCP